MKINAVVNGEVVTVQIVRRKNGTTYIRRAAVESWNNPTPAQEKVRRTFAEGAMDAYSYDDPSRERVNGYIAENFANWKPEDRRKLNEIEQLLAEEYPGQVIQIIEGDL